MFESLDELWNWICNKMESVDCPNNCWKKDVMRRAKQQLIEERKLLKEETDHIEKEYEIMNVVSNQFKKIFQEPEKANNENNGNLNKTQQSDSSDSINMPLIVNTKNANTKS